MVKTLSSTRENWKTLGFITLVQFFFAVMIASFSYNGKVAFGVLIAIPPLFAAATLSRKGLYFVFYFMVMIFVVGQRTVRVGEWVRLVPAEVILWVLGLLSIGFNPPANLKQGKIPLAAVVLLLTTIFAVYTTANWGSYQTGSNINKAISYAKMMWMAIPAFFLVGKMINRIEHLKNTLTLLALGCMFLSFMGLSEYFQLGFMKHFGGFVDLNDPEASVNVADEFRRLGATFWGGPMLAGFLTICFPLILSHWRNAKGFVLKTTLLLSLLMTFLVIYYAGHRGLWVACAFSIACYFYTKGLKGIFIFILIAGLGLQFAPQAAKDRMQTLYGEKEDSSARKRKNRAEYAWAIVKKDPIVGSGWGASGLVHSDFLQLWADAGGIAFLSFLFLFGQGMLRLLIMLSKTRDPYYREYFYGFFSTLGGAFVVLAEQAFFNLPEQYVPFWIIMALAFQYPNIVINEYRVSQHMVMSSKQTEKKQNA